MKLYFKDSRGNKRFVTEVNNESEAMEEIRAFCEERNFRIYYVRIWENSEGAKVYDVGSHTEFFYLYDD